MNEEQKRAVEGLLESRPEFSDVVRTLGGRRNNRTELQVDACAKGLGSEWDSSKARRMVLDFFRELERLELGRLILGRRGQRTRFRWEAITLRDFAATAQTCGGPDDRNAPQPPGAQDALSSGLPRTLVHRFLLRPEFAVQLELPASLTPAEAARLAQFVQSLPFEVSSAQGV